MGVRKRLNTWQEHQHSTQHEAPFFFPLVSTLPTDVLQQGHNEEDVHLISI